MRFAVVRRANTGDIGDHVFAPLPLLIFARSLQNGQVIFFGSRVTHSRWACAPQTDAGKGVSLSISSALASA
jgi:hypothetical protein